jgi:NAD(P)-dependent dehydrogenase (short-subunit alcohol dehydrogenase family)
MNPNPSIALITGGNRGLGRSAALHLARQGTEVVLTYRSNEGEARAVVEEIEALGRRAVALPLDVAQLDSIAGFVTRLREALAREWQTDRFDYLLNNAGIGVNATFENTSVAQFDALVNVQFKGVFFLTQALLPLLRDGGRILNVSTGLTRFTQPGFSAYAAMKGAIEVWTRYLASELGPRRISVNVLAPGAIETDFGGGVVRDDAGVNAHLAEHTALGRVGVPDDIGAAVAALLSPGTGWINAQRVEASGGMFV